MKMADFIVDPEGNVEDVRGGGDREERERSRFEGQTWHDFYTSPGRHLDWDNKIILLSYIICSILVAAGFLGGLLFQIASSWAYARANERARGDAYGGAAWGCFFLAMAVIGVLFAIRSDTRTLRPPPIEKFKYGHLPDDAGWLGVALGLLAVVILFSSMAIWNACRFM